MLKKITFLFLAICSISQLSFGQWNTATSINNAICSKAGAQQDPRIVSDGKGGAIIAWVDNSSGSGDIYAQRIDKNGFVKWATNGVVVNNAIGDQTAVNITETSDGGVILTWTDRRITLDADIYAQKLDSNGTKLWNSNGAPVVLKVNTQQNPKILSDGNGGAFVVYEDSSSSTGMDIGLQHLSSNGSFTLTGNGLTICNANFDQINPRIETDNTGGAYIVWQDKRGGSFYDIYAQRVDASGAVQWAANGVAICTASDGQLNPKIEPDGNGGAIVAWVDKRSGTNYDIYAQSINSSGTVNWSTNGIAVCTAGGNQSAIELKTIGTSGVVAAWKDDRSGIYSIYMQRINLSGVLQWNTSGVFVATGINPNLERDNSSGVIIAFQDSAIGGSWNVYSSRFTVNGTNLTGSYRVVADTARGQTGPKNISDLHNGSIICWQDNRRGDLDIYCAHLDSANLTNSLPFITNSSAELLLFPNPTSDRLTVKSGKDLIGNTLSIITTDGKTVYTQSITNSTYALQIDLQQIPNGFYVLTTHNATAVTATPIQVIH